MQSSFSIYSGNSNTGSQQLFITIGMQGLSLIILDAANKSFTDLVSYHFSSGLSNEDLVENCKQIFYEEKLLQNSFKKTDVILLFPENVLTPHEVFGSISSDEMLDTIFGDLAETRVRTDLLYRHSLHNVYRLPAALDSLLDKLLPVANYTHIASLLPDAMEGDGLFAIFYQDAVTVLLRNDQQLKVVQSFPYSTAEDAAYQLLNVCRSFNVPVNETKLCLHGMIDKDSALFIELYKYFMSIEFAVLPEDFSYPNGMDQYPAHYFSQLFAIALCV